MFYPFEKLCVGLAGATVCVLLATSAPLEAGPKIDVVTLGNGDRITGEVKALERGRLEYSTDDAGTLYLEWDKLTSVVSPSHYEVVTTDGRRFLGSLLPSDPRHLSVGTMTGPVKLAMAEVTIIRPIGSSFWSRLDGTFDVGFSYTRSSGIAQLNFNSDTIYAKPAFRGRVTASLTQIDTSDGTGRDDRGSLELSYLNYRWREWFVAAAARFETNESLGLELRSQAGVAVGPRLVNSNRAQLSVAGGVVVNDERGVNVDSTRNIEGLFVFSSSYYTYDRPKTNFDLTLQYYPSMSNPGRHRMQLDLGVKREIFKDFYVSLNLYDTYDNKPPNPAANTNDVGVVTSIGWSY